MEAVEIIEVNETNFKEYTEEEIMAHCGLSAADFEDETTIEVGTKVTGRNERIVERRRNGIVTDTCLIDFEEEEYSTGKVYTVITWYDTNEPYAYRTKEKDMDFSTPWEARKEMRKRVIAWEKRFKAI